MRNVIRVAIPLLILAAGVMAFGALTSSKPEAKKKERTDPGALVEVIEVQPTRELVSVEANGAIQPARLVAVSPEVTGKVTWINPNLEPGGMLKQGEVLVRIDSRDYKLAVQQQYAQVDRAQTELEVEKGRKDIAEKEWALMGEDKPESSLALRDPQMRTAQVGLEAARSGLERAKLAVEKTVVKVPFNAWVRDKQVEVGQLVGPQVPLATLVGTDAYWVAVSVPVSRLGWIQIPGIAGAAEGSAARIWQDVGGQRIERAGRVIRLQPAVDRVGRMAQVLVEVVDPFGMSARDRRGQASATLPFLLGSYVNVEISGREIDGVIELPRQALRDGDSVYVMTPDNTLTIKTVDVVWKRPQTVLVASGLDAGDRVVSSPLAAAVEGMKLRTPDMVTASPPAEAGEAAPDPEAPAKAAAGAKEAANKAPAAGKAPAAEGADAPAKAGTP